MASLTTDKNGVHRIQFNDGTARRTIHLGDVKKKTAAGVKLHVEHLINAKLFGQPIPTETAGWLAGIGEKLHGRIVAAGLASPRELPPAVTLANVIDGFTKRRGPMVKPGTKLVWAQARRHLLAAFSENTPAASITPADADQFRRKLRSEYSEAYTAKMTIAAKSFFREAVRRKVLAESPFADTTTGSQRNPDRQRFIDAATIQKAIDAAPDAQWRVLIALARFGGLRVPSEPLALRWADINWSAGTMTVRSPKTERHAGGAQRVVPIFAELRPLLLEAFELAEPGQEYVIHRWRTAAVNLRTHFERILAKAGVTPWPRLWQNLRASRATELADQFPGHVCAAWLGHTDAVADKHYRQVTPAHLAVAIGESATESTPATPAADRELLRNAKVKTATQIPTQHPPEMPRSGRKPLGGDDQKGLIFPKVAAACEAVQQAGWERQDSNL